MINSEINTIELGADATAHRKQLLVTKKVALRDVQNNNSNLIHEKRQEILLPVEAKICGTKRLRSDPSLLTNNSSNEHMNYARRRYEFQGNQGRNLVNMETFTGYLQSANFSQIKGKNIQHGQLMAPNHTVSKANILAPKEEVYRFQDSMDEEMTDRFIRLQNFIKHCDGPNHRGSAQLLQHLSPSELSRHAVELEKRAIQLTIEEGKEMQRMMALNILGKPSATKNSMQITQHIQPKS